MVSALSSTPGTLTETFPHDDFFTALADREFSRLRAGDHHYLDYTGGGLCAASQVQRHHDRLQAGVFGNPHSVNPASIAATEGVERARKKVLDFFNAGQDYFCVFTANATGALKIVGECFPWKQGSRYLLLQDNHNSVNGIREYCRSAGGQFDYAPVCPVNLTINEQALYKKLNRPAAGPRLFAYPAQSNVSGVKHTLAWVRRAKAAGWHTLLDAAAFVPTNKLDLQRVQPDFVALSFYKMFGYPTGIGALLIRKPAMGLLQKRWFAGGNVQIAGVAVPQHILHNNHERFENGTVNYLALPAVSDGLEFLEQVGMERLQSRVRNLSRSLYRRLDALQHSNGRPLVRLYGPADRANCGGTIILNVLDATGQRHCFKAVEARAADRRVSIRAGCFCNPGLDEVNSRIEAGELAATFEALLSPGVSQALKRLSELRGATRASVGIATTVRDLDAFVAVIESFKE